MDEDYYKSIGFMCGLEIHQRLNTREKLFCSCTSKPIEDDEKPEASIIRYQRAVAGELGKIDAAAKIEEGKKKAYHYNIFKNNTCLVDIDEEPPHQMNKDALGIALSLAAAFQMHIFKELEPMRKEVVDGSNTSAFQRTTIVGLDGRIKVNGHDVLIPSMMLEEESAGIVSNGEDEAVFNTDRLGIPLVEIDTDPYIRSPSEAKDVASYIGMLLRITGKVQRGIGTIRQDVNVSIKGGARVEIKGFQDLGSMDKYIENEIERQKKLISLKEELAKVGWNPEFGKFEDITDLFASTSSHLVKASLENNGSVIAVKVKGFKGYLGKEINPDRRIGSEVSDYAKLAGVKGLIHGDEDLKSKYRFSDSEISSIYSRLDIKNNDSFIMVTAPKAKAEKALNYALERITYFAKGVPPETRSVYDDNLYTTRFMRPIAGGSRMYPETDAKPIIVTDEMVKEAELSKPNLENAIAELKEAINDETMIKNLLLSPRYQLYKEISSSINIDKKVIADILMQKFTEMKREGVDVDSISDDTLKSIFEMYKEGKLTKRGIVQMVKAAAEESPYAERSRLYRIAEERKFRKLSREELLQIIKEFEEKGSKNILASIMKEHNIDIEAEELKDLLNNSKV